MAHATVQKRDVLADWPNPEEYETWLRFEVTLKGWSRVYDYDVENDANIAPDLIDEIFDQCDALVKWVIAPDEVVLAKWLADNGLVPYLDEQIREMKGRTDVIVDEADGLDLVVDWDGEVIGGPPDAVQLWKQEAATLGQLLKYCGYGPIFTNHYVCPSCGDEWLDTREGKPDDDCATCGERPCSPRSSVEVAGFVTEDA